MHSSCSRGISTPRFVSPNLNHENKCPISRILVIYLPLRKKLCSRRRSSSRGRYPFQHFPLKKFSIEFGTLFCSLYRTTRQETNRNFDLYRIRDSSASQIYKPKRFRRFTCNDGCARCTHLHTYSTHCSTPRKSVTPQRTPTRSVKWFIQGLLQLGVLQRHDSNQDSM